MDMSFSSEDLTFRAEVRSWLSGAMPADIQAKADSGAEYTFDETRQWHAILFDKGWVAPSWPEELGGTGWDTTKRFIFSEECIRARTPSLLGFGLGMVGPLILQFGTDEQKERFLPKILSGEENWCQGYSEPNAGSDLANVQTRAERDGDSWVLNGQKVWTSGAAWSDWCFVVCRTDPDAQPKHRGISYLLCPMDQPGIEVRPIVQMTGDAEFSEVFFNDARTGVENTVGDVNGGWKVSMGTLEFERGASTLGQQMNFQNELDAIIEIAKQNGKAKDPLIRQRIADAWIGLRLQRYNALRMLSRGDEGPGRESMITKIFWATWHRDLGKLAMDVMGPESELAEGAPYQLGLLQRMYLFTRSDTIYAGSNQIQRNIIGERALGLPKEPRPA
jgi:alkylation response protein AidB-like acyl-CoA dehydrogenase